MVSDCLSFCFLDHDSRVVRLHGDETVLGWPCRFWMSGSASASPTAAVATYQRESMSHDSIPASPEAPRGASSASKGDRYDIYDANIRNFAPVARIMKNALPDNAKIAKEAKECMQECVSEFISFITSEGKWISFSLAVLLFPHPCVMETMNQILTYHSVGKMPSGEEENCQWRRHSLCHDLAWL